MSSAYEPKPSSTADRAISHLASLPAGAELMTSALAEALQVPPVNLLACLEAALKHGAIYRRQRDTHARSPMWWSLTDHSALPRVDIRRAVLVPAIEDASTGEAPSPAYGSQKPNGEATESPAKAGRTSAHSMPIVGGVGQLAAASPVEEEPAALRAAVPAKATDAEPDGAQRADGRRSPRGEAIGRDSRDASNRQQHVLPLRAALWSDGQLELRRGTTFVALLDHDETEQLVNYLVATGAGE